MAKKSSIYRNLKRIRKAEKFAAVRGKLIAEIKDKTLLRKKDSRKC